MFIVMAVIIAVLFLGLGTLLTHSHAYVLRESDWKCSNWDFANDKPHCIAYALKEKNNGI